MFSPNGAGDLSLELSSSENCGENAASWCCFWSDCPAGSIGLAFRRPAERIGGETGPATAGFT